jgi:hypothetical protein
VKARPAPVASSGTPSIPWVIALLVIGAALGSALTLALR